MGGVWPWYCVCKRESITAGSVEKGRGRLKLGGSGTTRKRTVQGTGEHPWNPVKVVGLRFKVLLTGTVTRVCRWGRGKWDTGKACTDHCLTSSTLV